MLSLNLSFLGTQANPLMISLNIVLIGFMILIHYRMVGKSSPLAPWYFPSLIYKICLGLAIGLLYTFYYQGGDTINMFEDGVKMAKIAQESPKRYLQILLQNEGMPLDVQYAGQPRALYFSKLISGFAILTQHHYWLTSIYFTLISFFSIWYLCILLVRYFQKPAVTAVAFLLYPSVAFWSAGIIKESIAMAMICFIVSFTLLWIKEQNTPSATCFLLFLSLLCILILWKIKYYFVAVLLPVVLPVVLLYRLKTRLVFQTMLMMSILIGAIFCVSWLHPNLNFSYVFEALVANHNIMLQASQQGDVILYQNLESNWESFSQNFGLALFSGLFRPLAGDGSSWLHWVVGLENLVLLGVTCLALCQLALKRIAIKEKLLVKAAIIYIIVLSVLLALSSPNYGTLMRYKVAYLPFLLYLSLIGCQPWIIKLKGKLLEESQLIKNI